MTESLFIACMAIVICIALLLIVWLIVAAVRKARHIEGKVVSIDDTEYVLVPVGENPRKYMPAAAPAREEHVSHITESAVFPAQPAPVKEQEVVATVVEDAAEKAEEEPADDTKDSKAGEVTLRRNTAVPYPDAYAALPDGQKAYIDEIIAHAQEKEGAKLVTNEHAACVYYGKKQLVRILLRRGRITARMQVQNNALASYADDNNLALREKPVDVRVENESSVGYIKGIIDINYETFKQEREMKEARKKEERRLKRMQKRGQDSQND